MENYSELELRVALAILRKLEKAVNNSCCLIRPDGKLPYRFSMKVVTFEDEDASACGIDFNSYEQEIINHSLFSDDRIANVDLVVAVFYAEGIENPIASFAMGNSISVFKTELPEGADDPSVLRKLIMASDEYDWKVALGYFNNFVLISVNENVNYYLPA